MTVVSNYKPYAPNAQGLTEVLIDFKSTMDGAPTYSIVGYQCEAFENVSQGEALYCRASDGKVGKAIANSTLDKAIVAGFAQTTKTAGQTVRVIVAGLSATSGLNTGTEYYLSAASAGGIVSTPPSTSGQYLTRVGETALSSELIIRLEPPILLS